MPHVQQVKIAKLAGCLALLSFHVVTTHVAGQIALDSRVAKPQQRTPDPTLPRTTSSFAWF